MIEVPLNNKYIYIRYYMVFEEIIGESRKASVEGRTALIVVSSI
jgi:hypothetical protein